MSSGLWIAERAMCLGLGGKDTQHFANRMSRELANAKRTPPNLAAKNLGKFCCREIFENFAVGKFLL
jgi:hypothetical protein